MAVTGLVGWQNLRGLGIGLAVPDEIYAGVPTLCTLSVTNRKRLLPSFLLTVRAAETELLVPMVDRRSGESIPVTLSFPRRGSHVLADVVVSAPFPVGFFVREHRLPLGTSFLVFPRPQACLAPPSPRDPSRGATTPQAQKGYEGELQKIAAYTGAEPIKLIHWRLSAREGTLKVKELGSLAREPVLLELGAMPAATLEGRLSCLVFLVNRLMRQGMMVGVRLGSCTIPPGEGRPHRLRLLRELALHGSD